MYNKISDSSGDKAATRDCFGIFYISILVSLYHIFSVIVRSHALEVELEIILVKAVHLFCCVPRTVSSDCWWENVEESTVLELK